MSDTPPPADDGALDELEQDLTERSAELLLPSRGKNSIPRVVSLIVLIGVLIFTAVLFFRVMALFVVPLFLAGVLVVVFEPVFKWFLRKLNHRTPLAALATTVVILASVFAPCALLTWRAYAEIHHVLGDPIWTTADPATPDGAPPDGEAEPGHFLGVDFDHLREGSPQHRFAAAYEALFRRPLNNDEINRLRQDVMEQLRSRAPKSVLVGLKAIGAFGLGLVVMTVSVYFFFADGPAMVKTLMHLSPLDNAYESELLERFAEVSRAVVLATVLAAIVQGTLAGLGYWLAITFTGAEGWPIFLLTMLTMILAMVPFVGAAAGWVVVSVGLFLQGHTGAAVALAVYGAGIVSTADNVVKPLVLHGQSNLHPLLALLSVLGGVTVLGPIGILVGPMLVAFLQALLTMLRKELDLLEEETSP
ncbi:MAG: AI-2E family transporter, partial [Planctomycetales bacterium]|nr:AI-2E family transporter [Planctomycetales bacterium]